MVVPLGTHLAFQRVVYSHGGHVSLGEPYSSLIQLFESITVGFGIFNLYLLFFYYGMLQKAPL